MKTLKELKQLRDETRKHMNMRQKGTQTRIQVGMATCGIAAGAREVVRRFMEEIERKDLADVYVVQVGCMGECAFEPLVEIIDTDGTSTIYAEVNEAKASEIIAEHVMQGKRIDKYTLQKVKV